MDFFSRFAEILFPPRPGEEIVRDTSPETLLRLVAPVLVETTHPATTALLPFRDTRVRALIHETKYRGSERAAELLGVVLAEYLADIATDTIGNVLLVPLPLSRERMKERGFNQCERIACYAVQTTNTTFVPVSTTTLIRIKNTEHQALLSKEARKQNAEGAFTSETLCDAHTSYLILDDVITTGATMQAAIDALTAQGAKHILPITLAHA